jgi:hypothetical protein
VECAPSPGRLSTRIGHIFGKSRPVSPGSCTDDNSSEPQRVVCAVEHSQAASTSDEIRHDRQSLLVWEGPQDPPTADESSQDRQAIGVPQTLWDRAYRALAEETPEVVKDYEDLLANEVKMPGVWAL